MQSPTAAVWRERGPRPDFDVAITGYIPVQYMVRMRDARTAAQRPRRALRETETWDNSNLQT